MSDTQNQDDPRESALGEALPDELRSALDGLRHEIRARFSAERVDTNSVQKVEWGSLIQSLQRRISTLGMTERSGEVDEFGMDEVVLRRSKALHDLLYDHYWRVELRDAGRIPVGRPCLLVANRSGLLPYDGLMLAHGLARIRSHEDRVRFFVADWLITRPFAQPSLNRLGGVRACRENADRLLASGKTVVVFPEGFKGAAKVFRERYRLQRFGRGGVVRLALETGVPLIPVGIVGPEEAHPILFKWVAPGRMVGLPFMPITPTFPLLGPLGLLPLPTKWVIRVGEPLSLDHLDSDAASDELLISRLTEELRSQIQTLIDTGLSDRRSVWD